ncbi:protein of unknown function [Candidatus Promineifilum breve]|uniref:Uncharacterized protein n=1 Tax=Candidatus Promineifilum breve TaxID=1806508 RepID=A0A160T7W7_9CHLR|nr:protein of unknown function [Candidatus Promineifilum breve]
MSSACAACPRTERKAFDNQITQRPRRADTEGVVEGRVDAHPSRRYTIQCVGDRGVAQFGRALGLGPRGRRFESGRPDWFAAVV